MFSHAIGIAFLTYVHIVIVIHNIFCSKVYCTVFIVRKTFYLSLKAKTELKLKYNFRNITKNFVFKNYYFV